MGGSLACYKCCDRCSTDVCGKDRCTSVCFDGDGKPPIGNVQSIHVQTGSGDKGAIVYAVAGESHSIINKVCGDFGDPCAGRRITVSAKPVAAEDETSTEDQWTDVPTKLDQVLPIPLVEIDSGDVPTLRLNVGPRQDIKDLEGECKFNANKLLKVRRLSSAYGHWRHIRGDGNCFYRAVIFGVVELFLSTRNVNKIRGLGELFAKIRYDVAGEQRAHDDMLRRLQTWESLAQLERWVTHDSGLDLALIRACRRLVRLFLESRRDQKHVNGLTWEEMAASMNPASQEGDAVELYCREVVDPMGRDAEGLACQALPMSLGVGLRSWLLDRNPKSDLIPLDTPNPDGGFDVHTLFKPGHYDLLYPKADLEPTKQDTEYGFAQS